MYSSFGKRLLTGKEVMDSVRERSLPLFLQFIQRRSVSRESAVEFHNDMLSIYIGASGSPYYELIRDSTRACMKIGHLMTLEDGWFRSRSLLYWILYILGKGVVSIELANDMILTAFRGFLLAQNDPES